jgi:hypothetical protein
VHGPARLVEHHVARPQQPGHAGLAGHPGLARHAGRAGFRGPVGHGPFGIKFSRNRPGPAHPAERGVRRNRLDGSAHQCVGDGLGVAAVRAPTSLLLSGLNRTSWACSVPCARVPATSTRSPRARALAASHAG